MVNGVVTAARVIPEFHARELQLAGKLDKKQIACRDLLRRFTRPAHGPQATRHHTQNACILAHGLSFVSADVGPETRERFPLCSHGGIASELKPFALCKLCTGFLQSPLLVLLGLLDPLMLTDCGA
jgi:hypothetical protein